jgi:hypothetical protein
VSTFVRVFQLPAPRLGGMVVDGVSQWNKKEKKENLKYACLREWTTGNHNTFFLVSLSSIRALFIGRRLYHHHRLTPIPPPPHRAFFLLPLLFFFSILLAPPFIFKHHECCYMLLLVVAKKKLKALTFLFFSSTT